MSFNFVVYDHCASPSCSESTLKAEGNHIQMTKTKQPVKRKISKCYLSEKNHRNLRKYFEECTSYSSLHGVKYLGETNRTLLEKIGWFIIITISIALCTYFVLQTYRKWESTPILVSVGTTQMPIQQVTFPAVTICPAAKVSKDMVNIINKFNIENGSFTEEEIYAFKQTQIWCQHNNFRQFSRTFNLSETYDLDTLEFIYNNTPKMEEIFWSCEWSGDIKNCWDVLVPTFTEEGICYTFNGLDRSDLFEKGVLHFKNFNTAKNTSCYDSYNADCIEAYPYRTTPGIEAGLNVFLTVSDDYLDPCFNAWKGHKVIIHQPNELPSFRNNYFYIPLTESVTIGLYPQVIVTDESLRSYTVEQRKCYYDDEKNLTHFKYYSQRNCESECFLYATKLYQNCSNFYLPHININTTLCNATHSYAMRKLGHHAMNHLAKLNLNIPEDMTNELYSTKVPEEAKEICNCLPSCRSLKYDSEVTQTDYDFHDKRLEDINNPKIRYSKLSIYFKDAQFLPFERKEMFGLMDFVAYCGGLLGLFIGFSFIALLELVYFICCRPFCNIFLYGKKFWAGLNNVEKPKEQEMVSSD